MSDNHTRIGEEMLRMIAETLEPGVYEVHAHLILEEEDYKGVVSWHRVQPKKGLLAQLAYYARRTVGFMRFERSARVTHQGEEEA